nr:AAA domain-containing protein [Comamonas koreensis]
MQSLDGVVKANTLKVPKLILADGRYVTRGKPRSGGLAQVYRASDTETGETVAVKVFRVTGEPDDIVEESFRREVQALSELKHPGIIRILDYGRDDDEEVHYLVMDWVDQDLKAMYLETPSSQPSFRDWDSYYQAIGLPVLEALSFAHSRGVAHRDVKPSNVLLTPEGQVRLCDFGISKIRNYLAPGVTLAQFASEPFSPPEPDDGSYSYSRDVFGFAVLSLSLLSAMPVKTAADVWRVVEEVDVPLGVRKLLRRCLSTACPADRLPMAAVLIAELAQAAPQPLPTKPVALFVLTNKVRATLEHDMAVSGLEAERFVRADLAKAVGEQMPEDPARPGWSMYLYGDKYGYIARPDESGSKLALVSARDYSASELERRTKQAFELGVRFDATGTAPAASTASLGAMRETLAEAHEKRKHQQLEERESKLFYTWLDLLSAKAAMEKQRQTHLLFEKKEEFQEFLKLTLSPNQNANALLDQQVSIDSGLRDVFQGLVVRVHGNTLLIRPSDRNRLSLNALLDSGRVETDSTRTDMALDRQRAAVEAVRYGRSVNPELGKLIASPENVSVPPAQDVEFIQTKIDDDKKAAVLAAYAGPDLLVVEGPPGTGKTTFITELVLQTLRREPNARVLLTSQTHVALDNSLERIVSQSGGKVEAIRIGQREDDRIAQSTRELLLDEQLPVLRKRALASGAVFLEDRATALGIPLEQVRRSMALDRLCSLKTRLEQVTSRIQAIAKLLEEQKVNPLLPEFLRQMKDELTGLTTEQDELDRSATRARVELAKYVSKEDLAEFTQCPLEELRIWVDEYNDRSPGGAQLKDLLHIHADWSAEFGRSVEFKAAVVASAQVVAGTCLGVASVPGKHDLTYDLCIVDEASIATPTEVLVPMSRSHRTVLVGDNKQLSPFQDRELGNAGLLEKFGLVPADQKLTLFQRLTEGLPPDLRKTLTTQHRMLPALGNLVSECFYNGQLKSVERAPAEHLINVWPKPVMWFSTSRLPRHRSQKVGTSYYNDVEVEEILKRLSLLDFKMRNGKFPAEKVSVALLTGYGEQRQRLDQSIQSRRHEWKSFSDIYVNVVDAFQGREADVVLFSVTRSEVENLGFLKEMERINVALSRGRELLGIVGDHYYCQTVKGDLNPLKNVIEHMRLNPDDCQIQELKP